MFARMFQCQESNVDHPRAREWQSEQEMRLLELNHPQFEASTKRDMSKDRLGTGPSFCPSRLLPVDGIARRQSAGLPHWSTSALGYVGESNTEARAAFSMHLKQRHAGGTGLALIFDRLGRRCSAWIMPVGAA